MALPARSLTKSTKPSATQQTDAPWIGHSSNLVGVPTLFLASCDFNETPLPLRISGVREFNPELFEMLAKAENPDEAAQAFLLYMNALFGLDPEQREAPPPGHPRRYRSSFLKLIRGWGFDSNGSEGAVLKGWVESRFGLFPTFHKEPIRRISSPVWTSYVEEKMSSRFHNNSIHAQLDLLYEFCQWALVKFFAPGAEHLTLYRGVNEIEEHYVYERCGDGLVRLRLNNLASFSSDRDVAGCFGDTILTVQAPIAKILFFNDLLPTHPLKGEGEVLVIGGDYRAEARRL
ncbi:NAD(+)--dinitrogen-reductase ADP-D-ribosyltransferase [Rhodoblastus acidophilus]|uniref:NAD(+)--dinitrogen-reductase ADP-D-ribosyltransferase n=1 Tax=Candidatus Rhodoblastus alkanivorans TaxID=2954117 RepID=A0ABS9Z1I7_9HYPH|nr:NAD(+)--dinitrogen-reductase ADP-D-ribosyltransferase [Candidatus Rhodoblastus alkanivorans]MCI4679919.1 NAD(+)--dinitrogen-reductase ADP-D-ribosyltransferase [Candidatus Rhodoblastus alkanivorans]MCI4681506.1 NAD(+)--dinitrogen-reductase ADP-D-ribosyltransferase [Candidatus Rhodoblastus alkanivorans]MDI4642554.1 NAD(+)--dinitrogen-reductase ADP-D-ribosyltransferase [Rhodoblastus acidophilus]